MTCSTACQAKATLTVSKKVARTLQRTSRILGVTRVSLSATGTKVATIALPKASRLRLAKVGQISARVEVTTTTGGRSTTTSQKIAIKG